MTRRPYDWSPLAERDPVPGDPDAIRAEIAHLRRLARGLRDQAGELRTIASGGGLKGRYATALRGAAADLELRLRQTAERCEHVHAHLVGWATELDDFQSASLALLRRADHHHDDEDAATLHRSLSRLVQDRDDRADLYAGRIRRACDDVIKDSEWEELESGVTAVLDNKWASLFFESASWITTGVGLAALFLSPPGWVMDLALATTFALTAKDALAFAVGDGSWFDLGMDTVGLLSMGAGHVSAAALADIRTATKTVAEFAAEERATADALRDSRPALDRTYKITNRRGVGGPAKSAARRSRSAINNSAKAFGKAARQAERDRPMAAVNQLESLSFGGDGEVAKIHKDIGRMRSDYADHAAVRHASRRAPLWQGVAKLSFWTGTAVDGVDKGLSKSAIFPFKDSSKRYENLKGRFVSTVGTGW